MRKLFFGLALAIGIRSAWSDCTDTTVILKAGTTGFAAGTGTAASATYDPTSLNALIRGCAGGTMTVRLNLDAIEAGKTKDTVKLSAPIVIAGRTTGKTTAISMLRPAGATGVLDTIFTFVDNGTAPLLLVDSAGNQAVISNMAFARKVIGGGEHTVNILGKGSQVSACHFWTADKDSNVTGGLVNIGADSVLVERSLFRAPTDGIGTCRAIRAFGNPLAKVEIRSNVFQSTGVYVSMSGAFHVIANTFVGSRNRFNPLIIGNLIGTNYNNAVIMHNLFATKADTLPPIAIGVSGAITADSILRNAWSQGKTNLPLAVNDPAGAAATLRGATGANANIALPKGFSNYGPNSGDVKDYPLTQLRSDATLARNKQDFGKVYRVFLTGSWSGTPAPISDISSMTAKMYFPGFTSFLPGKPWVPNVKVGAFVDWDDVEVPSPLAAGVQGASFKLQKDTSGTDKAKITAMTFDVDYYKQNIPPATVYFFFSNTLSKLTASNDTTALKTAAGAPVRKAWLNFDSILSVPREVRNAGADIFVKMLQFRGGNMAPVLSTAAIGTLANFPGFPINDLKLTLGTVDSPNRTVTLQVSRGIEQIDSIRIEAMVEGGKLAESKSFPAPAASSSGNFTFTVAAKGTYTFQAVPVAGLGGGVFKAGSPTAPTAQIPLGITASDSLYVTYKTGSCAGATGESATPFCQLDSALKAASTRNGGTTIIVRNGSPAVNLDTLTIDPFGPGDTSAVTITSGVFNENRPIIRGTAAKEAVVITRRNVTLRGFTIEQPPAGAKPALVVKAGGSLIDANIFRASSKGAVAAAAIGVEVGATAEARITNNIVWGFAKGVQFASTSSANVKILFNTFVSDTSLGGGGSAGIASAGADSVKAVIANNFFSGQANAIDKDFVGAPVLDHNVRTAGSSLNGMLESGGLGASSPVPSTDIWVAKYTRPLQDAMLSVVDCNSLTPCNPLYGGSSTNEYNVTVTTDAFGTPRKNRKEVGAYEYPPNPSGVLGVLAIKPSLVQGTFKEVDYTVTGLSFDSSASETDSVQVFWSKTDVTQTVRANLDIIPANQRKSYPIGVLSSGAIKGRAEGIENESTKYWFYAALSRNPAPHTSRVMGFPYSDTLTTNPNFLYGDCDFKDSKIACPSPVGAFAVDTGLWRTKFEMRVKLDQAIESGSGLVRQPRYISVDSTVNQSILDLSSPFPIFAFDAQVPGLGTADSKQKLTWQVEFFSNPDLSGLDLFLLPKDPKGLPVLVPDWKITALSNGKNQISFESTVNGPQSYAFGKLQAGVEPGTVSSTDPAPQVYDFEAARDSSDYPIALKMKGSGFKTGNPLLLISTIPAGGTVNPPAGSKAPRVLSGEARNGGYPSKTVVVAAGYGDLPEDLRKTRLYQLYLKAVEADAASPAPKGQKKPFTLDSVSMAAFEASTSMPASELDLAGGEMNVKVPVGKFFNDYLNYADSVGTASRSLEVVFTVFDGSRISRSRGFIRTKFYKRDIQSTEFRLRAKKGFGESTHDKPHWNLFGYPWDEDESGSLARILEKEKWDPDHMRLWWYKGTGEGPGAFNQYDGTNPSAIKFDSGMAAWSGSTNNYTPQCASGMSLDYQPFKMGLDGGRFYDFAMPFNFPMKWQDILDSSSLTAANAPAMWHYNDSALPPRWDKIQAASASPPTQGSILVPWEGYTVKASAAVTLTFPVMDTSRGASVIAKAAAGDGSWAVEVEASDATAAMELRIGRGARERIFPEAPDIPGQDFRVSLLKGDQTVSEHIQTLEGGWQGHWPLRAKAAKGSGGLSLRIGEATRPIPVWLVDAMHGTAVPLSAEQPVRVSEGDLAANDYHLVAGDKAYVDGILQGLTPGHLLALSNYPNPFNGSTLFRYALPAGFSRTTFDLKVRDFRGRTVWEKTIVAGNALNYLWDGRDRSGTPLPAGVYTLSLTAKPENKAAYRAVRNLLRM